MTQPPKCRVSLCESPAAVRIEVRYLEGVRNGEVNATEEVCGHHFNNGTPGEASYRQRYPERKWKVSVSLIKTEVA